MEKLIKDGMVAVVYSPGFGAGWSTWNRNHAEFLSLNKDIAQAVLDGDIDKAVAIAEEHCGDIYTGGADGLKIEWVYPGQSFRINEYDGSESVVTHERDDYMTA
jgi:hypothetical protein